MTTRYFEDWTEGETFETRGASISESQILDFGWRYDPQPFHIDLEAAARTEFGGLIASGFHTLAHCFRLFYDTGYIVDSNIIGVGIDELRWTAPVRPGDTLRSRVEVLELRASRSKPDRGSMRFRLIALNQRDEAVMTFVSTCVLRRRRPE